jgi:hypothetical protein
LHSQYYKGPLDKVLKAELDFKLKLCFISLVMDKALEKAIANVGSSKALAEALGVSAQAVSQWDRVPPLRVLDVERVTGVPRHELRPDMYPVPAPLHMDAAS